MKTPAKPAIDNAAAVNGDQRCHYLAGKPNANKTTHARANARVDNERSLSPRKSLLVFTGHDAEHLA